MDIITLDDLTNELVMLKQNLLNTEKEINEVKRNLNELYKQKRDILANLEKTMENLEIYKKYSNQGE